MATIRITKKHEMAPETVRSEVERLAESLASEFSTDYSWQGDRMQFRRSGASGYIDIHEHKVEIEIKLGVLLTPLKATIESKITDYLDRKLV